MAQLLTLHKYRKYDKVMNKYKLIAGESEKPQLMKLYERCLRLDTLIECIRQILKVYKQHRLAKETLLELSKGRQPSNVK